MKTVLVTGAKGFVGSNIVKRLEIAGYKVIKTARSPLDDGIVCDLSTISFNELSDKVPELDIIVHTACNIPRRVSDDTETLYNQNITMDKVIAELSLRRGVPSIYISSCGLYGTSLYSLNENSKLDTTTHYLKAKHEGEILFKRTGLSTILRISSPYGIGMSGSVVISNFIKQALSTKKILVWGDGQRAQNFIHVDDIAACVELSMSKKIFQTFNVTADYSCTMTELAITIKKQVVGCALEYVDVVKGGESHNFLYNNEKAYTALGWFPKRYLHAALIEIINELENRNRNKNLNLNEFN